MLKVGGAKPGERLGFVEADLTLDAGWTEVVSDCAFVPHVASLFILGVPRKSEGELIIPDREGTRRVLRAARNAGVRRVVLTSSSEAIVHDDPEPKTPSCTEADWSDANHGMLTYGKSKTLAERTSWDFITRAGSGLEFAVVNPVCIFGPVLGPELSASIDLIAQMLRGAFPQMPHLAVDVVVVSPMSAGVVPCLGRPRITTAKNPADYWAGNRVWSKTPSLRPPKAL